MRFAAALLFGLTLFAPAARAQVDPAILKAMLGTYLVAPNDGKPGCRITLESAKAAGNVPKGAMVAKPAPDCATTQPRLADTIAWVPEGVTLYDGTRHAVMRFGEDETTMLKTDADRQPQFVMARQPPSVDRMPVPAALKGRWTFQREDGKPICEATLGDALPDQEGMFRLTLAPGCDAALAKLKLDTWRVEDFALVLEGGQGSDKETSLAFDAASPTRFAKSAREKGKKLFLVRG